MCTSISFILLYGFYDTLLLCTMFISICQIVFSFHESAVLINLHILHLNIQFNILDYVLSILIVVLIFDETLIASSRHITF
jgi:hypothetical protein